MVSPPSIALQTKLLWHGFTDRNLYRPGETVYVSIIALLLDQSKSWHPVRIPTSSFPFEYEIVGPQFQPLTQGHKRLSSLGFADVTFRIPESTKYLGECTFKVKTKHDTAFHVIANFHIHEFRRPQYEISFKPLSPLIKPVVYGDEVIKQIKYIERMWKKKLKPPYLSNDMFNNLYFFNFNFIIFLKS